MGRFLYLKTLSYSGLLLFVPLFSGWAVPCWPYFTTGSEADGGVLEGNWVVYDLFLRARKTSDEKEVDSRTINKDL